MIGYKTDPVCDTMIGYKTDLVCDTMIGCATALTSADVAESLRGSSFVRLSGARAPVMAKFMMPWW